MQGVAYPEEGGEGVIALSAYVDNVCVCSLGARGMLTL